MQVESLATNEGVVKEALKEPDQTVTSDSTDTGTTVEEPSSRESTSVEPADAETPEKLSPQDSAEESQEHGEDVGKPKRRGSGRRRERVNSKKAAAAQSSASASAKSIDGNDEVDASEENAIPAAKESTSPENPPSETDTKTVTQTAKQQPADEAKVSQRQPSQLKSSVRSLANKDETSTGGLSLASRKVPDVISDKAVGTSASKGSAAVQQSTPAKAADIPSQAAGESSAIEADSESVSDTEIAAEKVND